MGDITDFFILHKKIYIFGAGQYGIACKNYALFKNVDVLGFITSSGGDKVDELENYKAESIINSLKNNVGVVIAMKQIYQEQVLLDYEFKCDIYQITEKDLLKFECEEFKVFDEENNNFCKDYCNEELKNIVLIQLEVTYGDMLWSSAFIRELRHNYQNANITLILNDLHKSLYENCPYIDELITYSHVSRKRPISEEMLFDVDQFVERDVPDKCFDAAFLLRYVPLDGFDMWENIILMQKLNCRYRFGFCFANPEIQNSRYELMKYLFTNLRMSKSGEHFVEQKLKLLELVNKTYDDCKMEMWIGPTEDIFAEELLNENKIYISLAVVGSTPNKNLSPDKYLYIISKLESEIKRDVVIVLLGGKDSISIGRYIEDNSEASLINLTGKTSLLEAGAVIKRTKLYMGPDTGLKHMAAALDKPIVEISHIIKNTPINNLSSYIYCGPWCVPNSVIMPEYGLDGCKYKCDRPSHCINIINLDQVVESAIRLIH